MLSLCCFQWFFITSILKKDLSIIILLWIMKQSDKEHTDGDVKQRLKLVPGSRDPLDVFQVEKARWQSGELVLREIYLP